MEGIKHFSFLALCAILFSCGEPAAAEQGIKNVEMSIEGMSCGHSCAPSIQIKLIETQGVKEARVDFESKKAWVSYDAALADLKALESAVESIAEGIYDVTTMKEIAALPKDTAQ